MAVVEATLKQWGNSYGIIVPSEIVKRESLHIGDKIKVDIMPNKRIDAFGILSGKPSYKEMTDGHEELWK